MWALAGGATDVIQNIQKQIDKITALKTSVDGLTAAEERYNEILKKDGREAADAWYFNYQKILSGVNDEAAAIKAANELTRSDLDETRASMTNLSNDAKTWGSDMVNNYQGGVDSAQGGLLQTIANLAGHIKKLIGFSEPEEGPLSDFHTYAPDMMALFAKGVTDNTGIVTGAIDKAFDFGSRLVPGVPRGGVEYTETRYPSGQSAQLQPIILTIDGREFARIELPYLNEERQRIGVQLARG